MARVEAARPEPVRVEPLELVLRDAARRAGEARREERVLPFVAVAVDFEPLRRRAERAQELDRARALLVALAGERLLERLAELDAPAGQELAEASGDVATRPSPSRITAYTARRTR